LPKKRVLMLSLAAWYVACVIAYVLFLILVGYEMADRIKNALVAGIFAGIGVAGHIYIERRINKI